MILENSFAGIASVSGFWKVILTILRNEGYENLTRANIAFKIKKSNGFVSKIIKKLRKLGIVEIGFDENLQGTSKDYLKLNISQIVKLLALDYGFNEEEATKYAIIYNGWVSNKKYKKISSNINDNTLAFFDDSFIEEMIKKTPHLFYLALVFIDLIRRKNPETKGLPFEKIPDELVYYFSSLAINILVDLPRKLFSFIFSPKILNWWEKNMNKEMSDYLEIYNQAKSLITNREENEDKVVEAVKLFSEIIRDQNFWAEDEQRISLQLKNVKIDNIANDKPLIVIIPLQDGTYQDIHVSSIHTLAESRNNSSDTT